MRQGWALWVTGLPASGKSTLVALLKRRLSQEGIEVQVIESDELRRVLTPNPTYSPSERDTFYFSLIYIGKLLTDNGINVIFDATANKRTWREYARKKFTRYMEVYLECPLEVCMKRDPKGIYRKAMTGKAANVPGIQQEYESPERPDVVLDCQKPTEELVDQLIKEMEKCELIRLA